METSASFEARSAPSPYPTVPQKLPVTVTLARRIRVLVDWALQRMEARFDSLYSERGRPSIAPERLLRASLLIVLYSIRSERRLMEQMNYNLLFRWFPPRWRRPVAGDPGVCRVRDGRPGVGRDDIHQEPRAVD